MSTPTKAIPPLVGVDTYQSSISFGRCQHPVPTLGVDTCQSEYHLGRCQHPALTLGVDTYLKENAEWQPVITFTFEENFPYRLQFISQQQSLILPQYTVRSTTERSPSS